MAETNITMVDTGLTRTFQQLSFDDVPEAVKIHLEYLYSIIQSLEFSVAKFGVRVRRVATEAISAGDVINLTASGGIAKAVSTSKPAHGFVETSAAIGQEIEAVLGIGILGGKTGLTVGSIYYLSTSPGNISLTKPATYQACGVAVTSDRLLFLTNLQF